MTYKNYNNDFFAWNGSISRKNYAINSFIVLALYICLSFVNFQAFEQFITFKFLYTAIIFMAEILKLVLIMSFLSLVFRRISDFAGTKPYNFQLTMKRLFVFFYVVPTLYLLCIRSFFDFIPFIINIMDIITFFVLIPCALISAIIIAFIKGL